ncbi:MAG TPA: sulfatase [Candidatus Limnocylindria bacterium]|nr:sulfatase [Candidatus Limnocylindria bacterium]
MTVRRRAAWLALALAALAAPAAASGRPSVVIILMDTTRADRFGSWGSGVDTTPVLDAFAAEGAQFLRHYANSHATRPSLPQIVSGRYFHPSILRPFEPDSHPRDYPFLQPDPQARLLTDLLRDAGYRLLGVTAHPWVDPASAMGRAFHHLEYVEAPPKRGHAGADVIVDRAIALWESRPAEQPTLLYVHLLDTHTPRWLPGDAPRFLAPEVPWQERFGRDGEPRFGKERRRWDFTDARDFTPEDRRIYRAFYDSLLHYTDAQLGRLLARLRQDDPTLARTLVVILADHGEQLGEEGRLKHGDSLIDAVQHTPLIIVGAGVTPGQRVETFTENVDIAPTLATFLALDVPRGTFDGRNLLGRDGSLSPSISRPAVYYAWSDYLAVRTDRWLLRVDPPGSPRSRCRGGETTLWRLGPDGTRVSVRDDQRTRALRTKIARRLGPGAERLEEGLRTQPAEPFFMPVEHWQVDKVEQITCVPIDGGVRPEDLAGSRWLLVRDGLLVLHGQADPLTVTVTVPDGIYEVAAGVRPLGWLWRVPGLFDRATEALRDDDAERFVALGEAVASGRRLRVTVPPSVGDAQRIVNLRLTPRGAPEKAAPAVDREHEERLRTLGYIE